MANKPEFEYLSSDTPDPIGKFKQPEPNDVHLPPGTGYPQTDIGKAGTMTKGRWMSDVKSKAYADARGSGAATRGKRFVLNRGD